MIDENGVKELVSKGNLKFDKAGREDFFSKHPHYSIDEVKECFLEGMYCSGKQIYENFKEEILIARKNNSYVLHKIITNLIFPKYLILGFYVRNNVIIFHIGPMSPHEEKYYKESTKKLKKKK